MSKVFISYRRDDSADVSGRIFDRLVARFGAENVFKDVDSIPLGLDFPTYINDAVGRCKVVLVVIGRQWLEILHRRRDEEEDFVRLEIEAALGRGIPVIPVLVQGAAMPGRKQLLPTLQVLASRNGTEVGRDPHFHRDMDRLLHHLDRLLDRKESPPAALAPNPPPRTEPAPAPAALPSEITNSIGMRLKLIPQGTFWMGGGGGKPGDRQVTVAQPFYLGVFQVTQGQWQAVMGNNPSHFSRKGRGKEAVRGIADPDLKNFPVECISWDDAQAFLKKVNAAEKGSGWVYRLPTEAEWEYACRGGAPAPSKEECSYHFYLDRPSNSLSSTQANFNGNHPEGGAPTGPYLQRTSRVGSYQPNQLGLYDMHGNLWEWCADEYEQGGTARVFRGGCWDDAASNSSAAGRGGSPPAGRGCGLGFRLSRVPSSR